MNDVRGRVADGFEPVRDALAGAIGDDGEKGAALAAYFDGECVVDLWGGDRSDGSAWTEDTLACMFSVTKGMTAMAVQLLAARGGLDVEQPVAHYWPEFATNGKAGVLVKHMLNHSAGLLTVPRWWELARRDGSGLADTDAVVAALAAAPLTWAPGTAVGYHALTYGWVLGELVRRIDGRTLGRYFADEIAAPLDLDLHIGTPDELHDRVTDSIPFAESEMTAEIRAAFDRGWAAAEADDMSSIEAATMGAIFPPREVENAGEYLTLLMNLPSVRRAEIPAGNGIGTARSLAKMYSLLAQGGSLDGVELLAPSVVDDWRQPHNLDNGGATGFGLGYALYGEEPDTGIVDGRFGHNGAGGSLGYAHPEARLSIGWTKNRMMFEPAMDVIRVVHACAASAG